MRLANNFAKLFLIEFAKHRWPHTKGQYSSKVWTREMEKILSKTAMKLGLAEKKDELKRVDFTFYRKRQPIPAIVAEHENYWQGIFEEELPKLLASNAELKVLICYPPPDKHVDIADELLRTLHDSERAGDLSEEFLLIMGHPEITANETEGFTAYWCHQDYVLNRVRKPWFADGSEVYFDPGDGWEYLAKVLGHSKNGVKVEVLERGWKGRHVQETKMDKIRALD